MSWLAFIIGLLAGLAFDLGHLVALHGHDRVREVDLAAGAVGQNFLGDGGLGHGFPRIV